MKLFSNFHFKWNWICFQLTENKFFEYELLGPKHAGPSFELSFIWKVKRDHGGPEFTIDVPGLFCFNVRIYDHRHWNYDTDAWEVYPGEADNEDDADLPLK
jgi:hypothetical protein